MVLRNPGWLLRILRGGCVSTVAIAALAGVSASDSGSRDTVGTLRIHVRSQAGRHTAVLLVRGEWRIADGEEHAGGMFVLSHVPAGRHTLLVRGDYCGPVERPVTVKAGTVESIEVDLPCKPFPCPKLDQSDPGCIATNPEERAKVGRTCEIHRSQRLRLDVVPIHYGIVSFDPGGTDRPKHYPNADVVVSMGCVVGRARWAEVAYCRECRASFYLRNPRYLLQPIRPREIVR